MDNLPANYHTIKSPKEIIEQIVSVLQIPEVKVDMMVVKDFTTKADKSSDSFSVAFKGNHIRDFVVNTRRSFGKLTHPMILGQGDDNKKQNNYIYER